MLDLYIFREHIRHRARNRDRVPHLSPSPFARSLSALTFCSTSRLFQHLPMPVRPTPQGLLTPKYSLAKPLMIQSHQASGFSASIHSLSGTSQQDQPFFPEYLPKTVNNEYHAFIIEDEVGSGGEEHRLRVYFTRDPGLVPIVGLEVFA